ncbi:hypothetical protein CRG98_034693 [Punica granatum]|uniref:Uncharacterized protein n=1 Tax=Punica granatum TaxID=22663 RepID=A0A2I0ILN7_PUNGR|nr:hypothetical protein CRG98_034693 [Punica granatum]
MTGASVPTPFFPSCHGCTPLGSLTRSLQPVSCDSQGHFPDSFPRASRLVRRATYLWPLSTLLGLLTRASLSSCTANSPSHLARATCNLARSANRCEFTFLHRKFAEPPRSCLLQPHRQIRRATSFVPLANLPGLLTRASLLSCTASSLSLLARASSNLAGSTYPGEFTLLHRKFAKPPRSSPSHLARASCKLAGSANLCALTVRVYFLAPQVRRATSLVPLATLPGLQTRARLLSYIASSPSHLARASCKLAGTANPCELTFLLLKFAEPRRSCLLQPCRVCSPVRAYFPPSQVCRATSLMPLATLPGLLTRARLLSYIASSPSHLARASCKLAGSANPCELTFLHLKFAEPRRSCLFRPCWLC